MATWFRTRSHRGSLVRYLEPFSHTVAVMQTPEALHRVAYEWEDLAADAVVYAEVRFAPELHIDRGLSFDAGRPIVVRLLVAAMRHAVVSRKITELAIRYRDKGVVGFGIAGAEPGIRRRGTWKPSTTCEIITRASLFMPVRLLGLELE